MNISDNIVQMAFVQYESKILPKYKLNTLNSSKFLASLIFILLKKFRLFICKFRVQ